MMQVEPCQRLVQQQQLACRIEARPHLQQGTVVREGGVELVDEALLEQVFQIRTDRIEAAGRVWFMPTL